MPLADFVNNVIEGAFSILIAIVVVVFALSLFGDMIFEALADIRDSWNEHMGKKPRNPDREDTLTSDD